MPGAASLRRIQGLGTALLPPRSCQSTLCKGSNESKLCIQGYCWRVCLSKARQEWSLTSL